MITHVVLMRLHDAADAAAARDGLQALPDQIPELRSLRVGLDAGRSGSPWHLALETTHDSWDGLTAYQQAPAHVAFVEWLAPRLAERAGVDWES